MVSFTLFLLGTWMTMVNCQLNPGLQCDIVCDEEQYATPACASDGKLYGSRCEFNKAQCNLIHGGDSMVIVSVGACVNFTTDCGIVMTVHCIPGAVLGQVSSNGDGFEPVCGADGVTYDSVCEFRSTQCHHLSAPPEAHIAPLDVAHMGKCGDIDHINATALNCSQYATMVSGVAIEGGATASLHPKPCNKMFMPVCAIDGRTYGNTCMYCTTMMHMRKITPDDMMVYIAHDGVCGGPIVG